MAFLSFSKTIAQAAQAAQAQAQAAVQAAQKAQAAQAAREAANYVIGGSKPVENAPQIVQKAAAVPATVPTTTPTVAPSNQPAQPKTWKDYLLWIALGGVVAFGAYKMLTGKKKRR